MYQWKLIVIYGEQLYIFIDVNEYQSLKQFLLPIISCYSNNTLLFLLVICFAKYLWQKLSENYYQLTNI